MAKSVGKAGFKQSLESFREIMSALRKQSYSGVYLLMGEESYFIDAISDFMSENILSDEERDFSQTVVYGRDTDVVSLIELCRSYPMMSRYNLVIVKEAQNVSGIEKLDAYLKKPSDTTILVICYKGGVMDKRTSFYKQLASSAVIFESIRPRDYEISQWVYDLFRSLGRTIDVKAASMLVDNLGTDMSKLRNEAEKLVTSVGESVKEIMPIHIEENIGISKDFNNFELTKALSEGDAKKALMIADYFARNPKDNPFVVTITVLFSHFLRIFTLGIIFWNCKSKKQPVPSDMELLKQLKLANTFFLAEYKQAIQRYSTSKAFAIIGEIRAYDMKNKGIGGNGSDADLLKELIMKILYI